MEQGSSCCIPQDYQQRVFAWLHPTARLGKKAEARGGDKTAAAAGTRGAVGMGRLWVGRKVVELRPAPKTLGSATPDPVC